MTESTAAAQTRTEEKYYPLLKGGPDALVIHCSSPKFQEAFHDFLRDELGVKVPAVISIPGSAGAFGVRAFLPKHWYALRNQIEILTRGYQFSRIIVINHEDCKGYQSFARWLGGLNKIPFLQKEHLRHIANFLKSEYVPNASIELYQANMVSRDGSPYAQFERVL
jgi:hypothetical protein